MGGETTLTQWLELSNLGYRSGLFTNGPFSNGHQQLFAKVIGTRLRYGSLKMTRLRLQVRLDVFSLFSSLFGQFKDGRHKSHWNPGIISKICEPPRSHISWPGPLHIRILYEFYAHVILIIYCTLFIRFTRSYFSLIALDVVVYPRFVRPQGPNHPHFSFYVQTQAAAG